MEKLARIIRSAMGEEKFDLLIRGISIVNVFSGEIVVGEIGITEDTFAFVGKGESFHRGKTEYDGTGKVAIPGLIDSHMHIESSMMVPSSFACAVLTQGTTTVAADPHEIGNVLGCPGVGMFIEASKNLPLHIHILAPSTIPASSGCETSAVEIFGKDIADLMQAYRIPGLGEVMDFNGVIHCEERMLDVICEAKKHNIFLDGHASALEGKELQAFAATGIDSDHTRITAENVKEKLSLGICVQIQKQFITRELMEVLNSLSIDSRVTLVTDDIPILHLKEKGHLAHNIKYAMQKGLDPVKAIRYATINAADRLRLYDRGAIAPGRKADLVVVNNLDEFAVETVISDGNTAVMDRKIVSEIKTSSFPEKARHTMHRDMVTKKDFQIPCTKKNATLRVMKGNSEDAKTIEVLRDFSVSDGIVKTDGFIKIGVFERHHGTNGYSLGLLEAFPEFHGAIATTYSHDCHNLTVLGTKDEDMALAANTLLQCGGGLCIVKEGKLLECIPLPIAGLMSEEPFEILAIKFQSFAAALKESGMTHKDPLSFLSLLTLSVSPFLKLTDQGLIRTKTKEKVSLYAEE